MRPLSARSFRNGRRFPCIFSIKSLRSSSKRSTFSVMNISAVFKVRVCIMKSRRFSHISQMLILRTSIDDTFRKFNESARKEIRVSCGKESHRPFTLEKSEYIEIKEKKRNAFLRQRHPQAADEAKRPQFSLTDFNQASRSFP